METMYSNIYKIWTTSWFKCRSQILFDTLQQISLTRPFIFWEGSFYMLNYSTLNTCTFPICRKYLNKKLHFVF